MFHLKLKEFWNLNKDYMKEKLLIFLELMKNVNKYIKSLFKSLKKLKLTIKNMISVKLCLDEVEN